MKIYDTPLHTAQHDIAIDLLKKERSRGIRGCARPHYLLGAVYFDKGDMTPAITNFRANYDAFAGRIAALDEAVKTMIPTIPATNRKLLTYHDSWAYFADRYGLTVIGAVQPSDFSEPSARDVANLITQISEEGIPAVFGSEVFPSDVMQTIAAESGAAYVDELSDDDLPGGPGDPDHSYLGLAVSNLRIMIPALGGDASALDNVDISPVFDGESNAVYPQ